MNVSSSAPVTAPVVPFHVHAVGVSGPVMLMELLPPLPSNVIASSMTPALRSIVSASLCASELVIVSPLRLAIDFSVLTPLTVTARSVPSTATVMTRAAASVSVSSHGPSIGASVSAITGCSVELPWS